LALQGFTAYGEDQIIGFLILIARNRLRTLDNFDTQTDRLDSEDVDIQPKSERIHGLPNGETPSIAGKISTAA
jgi:hypothetical protein